MKKILSYMAAAVLCGTVVVAQPAGSVDKSAEGQPSPAGQNRTASDGVGASGVKMERSGEYLSVKMQLDMEDLKVSGNRAVLLTPRLINGKDSVDMPSVGIYGRRRWYYYKRNGETMLTGHDETSYRAAEKPESIFYSEVIPYDEWMNGAQLTLHRSDWGCCGRMLTGQDGLLGEFAESVEFFPELVYVRPVAEAVKSRSLEGSAYIDFPADVTAICPDYRRNASELGRIQATIDSVRNDSDVTITRVWLKGYASPESPYVHNEELAVGRTAALKRHISQLYRFSDEVISTDYEAENWAGLRRYVDRSNLEHRAEILSIIDGSLDPDAKEWKIKSTYPEEYRILLYECYPSLRRTDYRIAYDIRNYHDAEEIIRVMRTGPQKLSLNEFYLVAQEYEPGTDEFTEVFETAVRMYPSDETANLNAANAAMRRGDNAAAARYLAKAGDSPEAVYARGALAIRNGDYETARGFLRTARNMGLEQADMTLKELEKMNR